MPLEANWNWEGKILIHIFYLSLQTKKFWSSNAPTLPADSHPHENNISIFFVFLVSYDMIPADYTMHNTPVTYANGTDQILIVSSIANTSSIELKSEVLIDV